MQEQHFRRRRDVEMRYDIAIVPESSLRTLLNAIHCKKV